MTPDAPMLVVLNGPPAVGKTTLGARLAGSAAAWHHLDVDAIRSEVPDWESDRHAAGLEARRMMHDRVSAILARGESAVVSQLFGRTDDLVRLEAHAAESAATFVEVVLTGDPDDMFDRFVARGGEALEALQANGEVEHGFRELHDRVMTGPARRPGVVTVETIVGDIDAAFDRLAAVIDAARDGARTRHSDPER